MPDPDKLEDAVALLSVSHRRDHEAGAERLSTTPACIVPEIQFIRPGDTM